MALSWWKDPGVSAHFSSAVILMLTSGEQRGDIERCRKLGVSSFLTKPVRTADLRAALARALAAGDQGEAGGLEKLEELEERKKKLETSSRVLEPPRKRQSGSPLRILLAEDHPVNQRVAMRMLEKCGHRVVVAGNGRLALEALDREYFDLVLMDVQMPEMGGFEATAAIREKEKVAGGHIPIVAMTAHAMKGDAERCLAAGMDDYISKPVVAASLLEVVERCGYQADVVR